MAAGCTLLKLMDLFCNEFGRAGWNNSICRWDRGRILLDSCQFFSCFVLIHFFIGGIDQIFHHKIVILLTDFIAGCIAKRECGLIIIIMNQICQPVLHLLQMLGISIGLDDNEFVSTVSGKETVRIQYPCQAVGKCLDEFITFFVSVCVVNVFQIVQVEHHNTDSKGAWKFSEFSDFIFKRCFIMNSCNIPEGIDQ